MTRRPDKEGIETERAGSDCFPLAMTRRPDKEGIETAF